MNKKTPSMYIAISVSVVATLMLTLGAFSGGLLLAPYLSGDAQAASLSPSDGTMQTSTQLKVDDGDIIAAFEQAFIDIYDDTLPSVVNIRVTKKIDFGSFEDFDFEHPNVPSEPDPEAKPEDDPEAEPEAEEENPREFFDQGGGSGFVWNKEGHIVTNNHVVDGATEIVVIFADDTQVEAEIVGTDPDSDLAIIKVDLPASYLKPVILGDSDAMRVGQLSIAIGNPFGQEFTMTSGIISGVGRTIRGGDSLFSIPEV
ncbi:MAG: hypothetical protein GY796_08195, partial [Chloroflexi bacterium]|nr:hypothetical protein [Chloroflexota bacterium]